MKLCLFGTKTVQSRRSPVYSRSMQENTGYPPITFWENFPKNAPWTSAAPAASAAPAMPGAVPARSAAPDRANTTPREVARDVHRHDVEFAVRASRFFIVCRGGVNRISVVAARPVRTLQLESPGHPAVGRLRTCGRAEMWGIVMSLVALNANAVGCGTHGVALQEVRSCRTHALPAAISSGVTVFREFWSTAAAAPRCASVKAARRCQISMSSC